LCQRKKRPFFTVLRRLRPADTPGEGSDEEEEEEQEEGDGAVQSEGRAIAAATAAAVLAVYRQVRHSYAATV
jgi:hypothetical protein